MVAFENSHLVEKRAPAQSKLRRINERSAPPLWERRSLKGNTSIRA